MLNLLDFETFKHSFEIKILDFYFEKFNQLEFEKRLKRISQIEIEFKNHFCNCQLWSLEDKARDPKASDKEIAAVKRLIDQFNQKRNNAAEELSGLILEKLGKQNLDSPIFSETPGSILDRLSILSLKSFHRKKYLTYLDSRDENLKDENELIKEKNVLTKLEEQKADLVKAFQSMVEWIKDGKAQVKTYHQFKMYNEKKQNPYLRE